MRHAKPFTAKEILYCCEVCRHEDFISETGFDPVGGPGYSCPKCHHRVAMYPVKPKKPLKQRISRQRRKRLDKDAEYLAMRDIYLEQNPTCVLCPAAATTVHHICRGVHRAKSLLNSDTWLGACLAHHDAVERLPPEKQIALKQRTVRLTIERLRR